MTRALLLLLALAACSPEPLRVAYPIDGDSVVLTDKRHVRLLGVDTPELHSTCLAEREMAQRARRFVLVALEQPYRVELTGKREKYGRELGRLWIGDHDIADLLVRAELGRAYHGDKRQPWC